MLITIDLPGTSMAIPGISLMSISYSRYLYGYPWHLPDGTISRWISWPAEGFLEPRALTGRFMRDKKSLI